MVVILNRKGLENFQLELSGDVEVEITDEFTILQTASDDGEGGGRVWGLWIYEEGMGGEGMGGGRGVTAGVIGECAARIRREEEDGDGDEEGDEHPALDGKQQQQLPQSQPHAPPSPSPIPIPIPIPQPPSIPLNSKPQAPPPPPPPLFQPTADTQFFLSAGRNGLAQLSRHPHPAAPSVLQVAEAEKGNKTLEKLFEKAGRDFMGKGKGKV